MLFWKLWVHMSIDDPLTSNRQIVFHDSKVLVDPLQSLTIDFT